CARDAYGSGLDYW
nr:immunoglobulin heavy chain junction region [Macaca mulatta]MOV35862.1 immunoglobulin heavy chain junction region [Macaca mulatta]MOV35927.1 immunoglobulin heavy chain junction region [Macaca mulatta]MOV35930.1 immunoglobulin heavy chain junction region [Macaca mulatta]MOV36043.1 immunoglobulin heavy chain junction region [Macaca mulatta]